MTNLSDTASIKLASEALRQDKSQRVIPSEITLSNGIVLNIKPCPPMLLNSVISAVPIPPIPTFFNDDKGREEENPNHPSYIQALQDRNLLISKATSDLLMFACTSIKDIPEGCVGPEDDSWLPLAKMAMIDFDPSDKVERYLAWMRVYAIATVDDMTRTQTLPIQLSGLGEAEVDEVIESFRGGEGEPADQDVPTPEPSSNGDNLHDINPRGRTRTRRA